jgi:hypothetical protein
MLPGFVVATGDENASFNLEEVKAQIQSAMASPKSFFCCCNFATNRGQRRSSLFAKCALRSGSPGVVAVFGSIELRAR